MPKGNAIAAAVLAAAGKGGSSGSSGTGGLSPLVASYSQGYSADVAYSPLPRPAPVFLNGAFGPMDPIVPMPINQPREDTHRPDPRRYEPPVGWNLPTGTPGTGKLAPFAVLRALADTYSVARSCVDKRKQEIVGLQWDIVPTDEAEQALMGDESARADWEKRRAVVKEFFSHPDADRAKYPAFGAWLSAILEDRFVIDAVAVHLVPPRKKGAGPFGSDLAALNVLDGSTIQPLLDINASTPKPSAPSYQQYLYGVPRVDMMSPITDEDLENLDEPIKDFRADQLIYMRETPRDQSPWGFSCIEKALLPINIGLARQQYQNTYFMDGSIPGMFVTPGPEISTPQQIRQLQDALNAMANDIGAKHRIIVLPPGSEAKPQKPFPLADQFDEWIISQVSMPFGLTPMDLGVTPRVSAVQTPSESRELSQINSDKGSQTRIEPVCAELKTVIFDFVIQKVFKQRDMQFSWGMADRGKNRQALIDQGIELVKVGGKTLDELRISLGDTPYGLPETSVPLVYTATGALPLQSVAPETQGGPAALPAGGKPQQGGQQRAVTDDELTTPAHEAARALPSTPGGGARDAEAQAAEASAQKWAAQSAELEILARYLRKGRDLGRFRAEALPAEAVEAAARMLPRGVRAAVKAARDAVDAKRRQERRDRQLRDAAAGVAAGLGQLVRDHKNSGLSMPHVVDGGVAVMADGYRQAMAAGTRDASDDYEDTPPADDTSVRGDARGAAEAQRGYLMGLMQDAIAGLSTAAVGARLALYAATLYKAYNASYGDTVLAAHPTYEIIWELGDAKDHCKLCVDRDGKSFTVKDLPGWPGDGGFGGIDARGAGSICLGGPNCFPADTRVQAADIEVGYQRWYEGELVEIETADGHRLSGTPNHPVLTDGGWTPLGLLKEGDHLVCGSFIEPPAVDPHVQAVPAAIKQVVDTLADVGPAMRHPVLPMDFHGDGAGSREVEIVGTHRELALGGDTSAGKPVREFVLSGTDVGETALSSLRHAGILDLGPMTSPPSGVGGGDLGSALLGGSPSPEFLVHLGRNLAPSLVGAGGECAPLSDVHPLVDEAAGFATAADLDSALTHDGLDEHGRATDIESESLGGLAVYVALDKVALIKRRSFSGHVYNLETAAGWYIANGILVHNCRCSVRFVQGGQTRAIGDNTQLSWSNQYYDQQLQTITAARQEAAAARAEFVDSLPDGPAIRAATRDELRRLVADRANQRIRASGGYPGVSVEPQDIPASIIAAMLPPGLEGAAGLTTPQVDVAQAVELMFAAKGAAPDMTEREFTALMTRVLTRAVKDAAASAAAPTGAPAAAGAPAVDPQLVYEQLLENYRPEGIGWVRELPWAGPVQVALDRIDWDDVDAWAAVHDDARVAEFERRLESGAPVNPIVVVQVPGGAKFKVVDGHHRALAARRLGRPVTAWVGRADCDESTAPWFQAHLYQLHSGGDAANKRAKVSKASVRYRPADAAARSCATCVMFRPDGSCDLVAGDISADAVCDRWEPCEGQAAKGDHSGGPAQDPSRAAFLLMRAPNGNGKWRYLLHKRDEDANNGGTWGLPGGKTRVGETPWTAAVREGREELGRLPTVAPAAVWSRVNGDTVVWTFLVDLPEMFAPAVDGDSADETAGWGWFRRRDIADLPLHPGFARMWGALDFDDDRLGGADPGAVKAARGYELNQRSAMVCLDLPDGLIEPVPGGVSDFHITVVYLGPDVDDLAFAAACERAAAAASAAPGPLCGVVCGRGTFPPSGSSDGKTVVWAGVALPGAEQLRAALADLSASEHTEWHPHVTRAYIDQGDPLPDPLPALPVAFTHLSVHRGDDEVVRYPLGPAGAPAP